MTEATPEMTHMTIYVSVDTKRRFKAICARQGLAIGKKIAEIVEREEAELKERLEAEPAA